MHLFIIFSCSNAYTSSRNRRDRGHFCRFYARFVQKAHAHFLHAARRPSPPFFHLDKHDNNTRPGTGVPDAGMFFAGCFSAGECFILCKLLDKRRNAFIIRRGFQADNPGLFQNFFPLLNHTQLCIGHGKGIYEASASLSTWKISR